MKETTVEQLISKGKEPEIHVIPEQFYGVAGKAKIKPIKEKKASAVKASSRASDMSAVNQSAQTIMKPKSSSKKWMLIPILALLFLVGLGVGTWILLKPRSQKKNSARPTASIQPSTSSKVGKEVPPEPESTAPPEPESTAPSGEIVTKPEPNPEPKASPFDDMDGDGLTRTEETLYGTSEESSDSDSDGFSDELEVVNLYNPAGFKPTRLVEAGLVKTYESGTGTEIAYHLFYPSAWRVGKEGEGRVIFGDGGDETVVVEVMPNQEGQSLLDWFLNRNPLTPKSRIEDSTTKSGEPFLTLTDGTVSYVLGDGVVYVITLESDGEAFKFRATYRMMVNSFSLLP